MEERGRKRPWSGLRPCSVISLWVRRKHRKYRSGQLVLGPIFERWHISGNKKHPHSSLNRKVWHFLYRLTSPSLFHPVQVCTNTGRQFPRSTKFCNVTPNICGSLAWTLLPVILRAHRILNLPIDFGMDFLFKTCLQATMCLENASFGSPEALCGCTIIYLRMTVLLLDQCRNIKRIIYPCDRH